MFHTLIVLFSSSKPALITVMIRRPSVLNATLLAESSTPGMVMVRISLPVSASHSLIVPSWCPLLTIRRPSGLKATLSTIDLVPYACSLTRLEVPDVDCAVLLAANNPASIRAERDATDHERG